MTKLIKELLLKRNFYLFFLFSGGLLFGMIENRKNPLLQKKYGEKVSAANKSKPFFLKDSTNSTINAAFNVAHTQSFVFISDSDGDGYPDDIDTDDDNDGIPDVLEGNICSTLGRNLRIGYLNTTLGRRGLMRNMLSSPANFGSSGGYNKIPGITFVPYANETVITRAQLKADAIDIFFVGSSTEATQIVGTDKLSTNTNIEILLWALENNKGVMVMQNNVTDYGYTITNNSINPSFPYGVTGDAVFTHGYWPVQTFNMTGTVRMTISSATRQYETIMTDSALRPTFIRDLILRFIFIPDATIMESNQNATVINNTTLRVAADLWAYAFDTFLAGQCSFVDTDGDGIPNHLDLDSDNDGCPDAIEGSGGFTSAQLVNAGGTVSVGAGSSAPNKNLCASSACINGSGIPLIAGSSGQGAGDSQNASIRRGCPSGCYKPAIISGTASGATIGITSLNRSTAGNGDWPDVRKGAWMALESKTKGFVPNRLTSSEVSNIPAANLVEGMMVYNTDLDCLQINTDGTPSGWKCFNNQTCPD